jgi:hypothetical protein
MGRGEIFLTFSLLVEIEGHSTNEFVSYVYETEDQVLVANFRFYYITINWTQRMCSFY